MRPHVTPALKHIRNGGAKRLSSIRDGPLPDRTGG